MRKTFVAGCAPAASSHDGAAMTVTAIRIDAPSRRFMMNCPLSSGRSVLRCHSLAEQVGGDAAREEGAARDESGEVADRRRPFTQRRGCLFRRVDAAGGDDINDGAELLP